MNAAAGQQPRFSNLQLRVMSAIVLIAVTLAATWAGGIWFRAFAAIIALASLYEWLRITGMRPNTLPGMVVCVAVVVSVALVIAGANPLWPAAIAALGLVASAALNRFGEGAVPPSVAAGAILHCALPAVAFANLRAESAAGLATILFLYAVVWATDIMAYFTGRYFGGPKLAPGISPGKTWSGAIGGTAFGVLAALLLAAWLDARNMAVITLLALALSVAGQLGDLYESALKRRYGIKDSSNLIPGHGGVLDRVDALVVAAVVLYFVSWLASGQPQPAAWLFAG